MTQLLKKLLLLFTVLIALNSFLPHRPVRQSAATADAANQTVTVSYQKGDGKGEVSETDDGTLVSRAASGSALLQPTEYESHISDSSLIIRRSVDNISGQTVVDMERALIRFPNVIGKSAQAIPNGSQIVSATLKLTLSNLSGLETSLRAGAYRVLEDWAPSQQNGYLQSPNWRQRKPSQTTDENLWTNAGAGEPTSSALTPFDIQQIPNTVGGIISFNVTEAVKAWAGGAKNNGLLIKLSDESGSMLRFAEFYSSEWYGQSLRPALEVKYIAPPPPSAPSPTAPPLLQPSPTACTQEAKQCPDGSYVSRAGSNCEFAPCPTAPVPKPKPAKPAPKLVPAPAPKASPRPAPTEKPSATQEITPAAETPQPPGFIQNAFVVIQRRILETWANIVRLFRR